jgi:hypothetical protein
MAVATSTAILGAAALGAGASLYGASQASRAQKSAANRAADTQTAMFERQVELQEPFRQTGITAQNRILTLLGLEGGDTSSPDFGKYGRDFSTADFEADPGYGFRMSEGMKAVERSAAARGGLLSGATLKGIQRFGQDTASNEYLNAFNRYQTNRANQLNPLQSLYGGGQSSANVLTGAAGETGRGVAGAQMGAGAASASGYTGMANALTSGLSTGANLYMQYPLYNAMAGYYGRMGVGAGGTGYGPASNAAVYSNAGVPYGYGQ